MKAMQWLDGVVAVSGEIRDSRGEDSYSYLFSETGGMAAVLDGCGGLGARRYGTLESKSGAYLASRVVSEALQRHFEALPPDAREKRSAQRLQTALSAALRDARARLPGGEGQASGAMVRTLPTTLSCVLMSPASDGLYARFLWAGDSRGYVLTANGLVQATRDDLSGGPDAMENLYEDAAMNNVLQADEPFRINERLFRLPLPGVVIAATDGAFGCLSSPMDFEHFLLDTLSQAGSLRAWQTLLQDALGAGAQDDFTMLLMPFGWHSFKALRGGLEGRRLALRERFVIPMDAYSPRDRAQMFRVWETYKPQYYSEGMNVRA
ncbi:MAG: hypothetical protein GX418_09300 [Clostridiales bacterium]|nr:hypothetical protein [Clostridiales bacterium]